MNTLKNRGMLRINRQNPYSALTRPAHNELARHNKNFLSGKRDIHPLFDGEKCRL